MTEFINIWLFLERKFKTLPPYIKNVLKYCGYEDCHTIATIEENDLKYFTAEVRKGGITNFFATTGTENALQGSNTSEENFEFRRGHQKLLMVIVKFVRENLNENGVDAFSIKLPKPLENLKVAAKTTNKSRLETKDTSISTLKDSERTLAFTRKDSKDFLHEDLIDLQASLLKQTIRSLFTHSSEMYNENVELIGNKICNGLVYITEKIKSPFSAEIQCPYCAENITVSHILNESLWNTATFDSHLTIAHYISDKNFILKTSNFDGDRDGDLNRDVTVETSLSCICLPSLPHIVGSSDCDTNIEDKEGNSIPLFAVSEFHEDKIIDNNILAKEADYVICSVTKKSSMKWPECIPKATYFVGQILRLNGPVDGEIPGEIKLQVFKRNHDSKFIFDCVKKDGIQVVSAKNIFKILEVPTRNRRNKLVFRDKTLLQYNI